MSDIKAQLEGLRHDWSVCKAQDDQKHSLITSLFNHVDSQSDLLLDANAELRDKKDAIKLTRERVEELEEQLRELQLEKDRHAFVLVIIDGDCMPFRDDLVRDGLEGGKRTASILKQAVEGELKSFDPSMPHHLQVIVRVYANLKGLAKTYKDTSILPAPDSLEAFVSGFNMGDTLCDYVDAGNGKECADEKVKASFQHHLADVHCRKIFFGASADSAYARLLGKYLQDEVVRRRICLIEGPPWAQELADFKDKFHTVLFDTVFRSQKLPNIKRRVSFRTTPPTSPSANYANAASRAPSTPAPVPPAHHVSVLPRGLVSVGILRNSQGQRVDSQLTYSSQDFNDLKSRKLCNYFHLLGTCPYQKMHGNCQHDHDKILSQAQKAAMRAIARLSPCPTGLVCSNPDCLNGHRCAWENCSSPSCRFPREMHNVDTRVISE